VVGGILEELDFNGVVHLVADDAPPLTLERGLADRAAGLANTIATRFAAASVSKLATSLTVGRLVDRDVVSFDTPYADLVGPEWRPAGLDPAVTVAHLLGHVSGLADYFDEHGAEPYWAIWMRTSPAAMRGPRDFWPLLRDRAQLAPPGERAVYNNGAFILVGIALEEVTGMAFPELVRAEVLEPLEMTRSGFWAMDEVVPELAVGYISPSEPAPDGWPSGIWRTNVFTLPAMGGPDGGIQLTAPDAIRLVDGLAGRGSAAGFISASTRARLIGPHVTSDDRMFRFGLGVLHAGDGPSARYGHTGEDSGASARVWTYPATGERVAVLSNLTGGARQATLRIDALLAES
jgi:CubicO group peptidase (beta-lactamase class C family)